MPYSTVFDNDYKNSNYVYLEDLASGLQIVTCEPFGGVLKLELLEGFGFREGALHPTLNPNHEVSLLLGPSRVTVVAGDKRCLLVPRELLFDRQGCLNSGPLPGPLGPSFQPTHALGLSRNPTTKPPKIPPRKHSLSPLSL